jgi:hypothetical protein
MQARSELGAVSHHESMGKSGPSGSSFKSKKPLALIATPDLDLWGQLGPMLESTCQLRHADSLTSAAALLKPGTRTILVADLRGLAPEDFAPISGSPHNPVVIAIRDGASAGMVDALNEAVHEKQRPFLGICVGMQLMATLGIEYGEHRGLDWIKGKVVKLTPDDANLKIPQIGWNNLSASPHPVCSPDRCSSRRS